MTETRPFWFIGGDDISTVLDSLRVQPKLALDTESDSFYRYVEKVCLLQISSPTEDVLYDPLAAGLTPDLRALLEDDKRTWVVHGADYDVLSLRRDFDLKLGHLFDTSIAARFLGMQALGLGALTEALLGLKLSKAEQRSDWARRPLTESQIRYAVQDTQSLLPLAAQLEALLKQRGRWAWAEEECALLRLREPVPRSFDPDGWLKIRGARDLGDAGQRALAAAYIWRDRVARRQDRAPFRIVTNEVLERIAQAVDHDGPAAIANLASLPGMARHVDIEELTRAIRTAIAGFGAPRRRARLPPSSGKSALGEAGRARLAALKAARLEWAAELGLDAGFMMPSSLCEAFARDPPSEDENLSERPGMTRWRDEAFGEKLRKF